MNNVVASLDSVVRRTVSVARHNESKIKCLDDYGCKCVRGDEGDFVVKMLMEDGKSI